MNVHNIVYFSILRQRNLLFFGRYQIWIQKFVFITVGLYVIFYPSPTHSLGLHRLYSCVFGARPGPQIQILDPPFHGIIVFPNS